MSFSLSCIALLEGPRHQQLRSSSPVHLHLRQPGVLSPIYMSNKHSDAGVSSDIYDAAVAGMKKATRLNHNAAATRKPISAPNFNGLASLGPLFSSELKLIDCNGDSPQPRLSRHGPSPRNKHRVIGHEDEKQANTEIVWPSVTF